MDKLAKQYLGAGILSSIIFILLITIVVADIYSMDNKKTYDTHTKTVTITDKGNKAVAKIQLLTPQHNYVIRGEDRLVAEFKIKSFNSYQNVFNKMEFYNMKKDMKQFDREFTYRYKTYYDIELDDYETVCEENKLVNGSIERYGCVLNIVGSHIEQRERWETFDDKAELPKGDIILGIFTDVLPEENVEWIFTLFDVRMPEFASWEDSFNEGLILYYSFDDTLDTSSNVVDVTYQEFNLTTVTGSPVRNASGKVGGALHLLGASDNIKDDRDIGTRFANSRMSLCGWINFDTHSNDRTVFVIGAGSNKLLWYHNNGVQWQCNLGSDYGYATYGPTDGVWDFVCVRYYGANMMISVNGANQTMTGQGGTSYDMSAITGSVLFNIMSEVEGTFDGSIDEFGVWNRTLKDTEITAMYNEGTGMTYVSGAGMCSPTADTDWDISDAQVCDDVSVTTGTGSINILAGGSLYLTNSATVTTSELNLLTPGDQIIIDKSSKLITT